MDKALPPIKARSESEPALATSDVSRKIKVAHGKIAIELACQTGAQNMLTKLTDENAIQLCEQTIIESEKRLEYLNNQLLKLEIEEARILDIPLTEEQLEFMERNVTFESGISRQATESSALSQSSVLSTPSDSVARDTSVTSLSIGTLKKGESAAQFSFRSRSSSSIFSLIMNTLKQKPTNAGLSHTSSIASIQVPLGCAVFTPFDLWQTASPWTVEKVNYKLKEIRHKLDVEQKAKSGTERMFHVIKSNPQVHKKTALEIQEKLKDCSSKVGLLKKAELRYKGLYVSEDDFYLSNDSLNFYNSTDAFETTVDAKKNKKLFTGKLHLKINTLTNLSGKKSSKSESYIIVRIDGVQRIKTRSSRGKINETVVISIDKGRNIEILAYETGASLLALIWFKISDLQDSLTSRISHNGSESSLNISDDDQQFTIRSKSGLFKSFQSIQDDAGVDYYIDLEPSGHLHCRFNLVAEKKIKPKKDGITRRKMVKKIFPRKGHKFVATQFYSPMKCAYCGDFILSGQGYQCQLCRYTCHRDCNEKVILKCITKGSLEEEDTNGERAGEFKISINHSIPHRFVETTQLSASWCCHCGSMVPIGKKQSLKCSECNIASHKECQHLVPNYCGLNPQRINMMLRAIDEIQKTKNMRDQVRSHLRSNEHPVRASVDNGVISHEHAGNTEHFLNVNRQSIGVGDKFSSLFKYQVQEQQKLSKHIKGITLDDFNFVAVLGKGNFGKVMLAEEKATGSHYAIKVLKKDFIIENDEVESTKSEKRVFLTANKKQFPFLVNLHSCFQTESRLYFVMEYVSGGDLMWHIQNTLFEPARAQFYAAEVLLALEYIHHYDIVYRDLKLDNILLSIDGHIKLADYGLCKESMHFGATTRTFCGTPEFMAPEILMEKPYGRAVDWWGFGVLVYELILGRSPFKGDDEDEIFDSILQDHVIYPITMSENAKNLIQKLLVKDPSKRLGSTRTGAKDIKKEPYFEGVDWEAMLRLEIEPPFKPSVTSANDISNFDVEFTKEVPVLTPTHSVLTRNEQEAFRGFTYISDAAKAQRLMLR